MIALARCRERCARDRACAARASATLEAIEYYNQALDHYFVTALADEIAKLDAGVFVGWQRTRLSFKVFDPATPAAGASPVCRFYGTPAAGLDSHFYSASAPECADGARAVSGRMAGGNDQRVRRLPARHANRPMPGEQHSGLSAMEPADDSNHRFTTDPVYAAGDGRARVHRRRLWRAGDAGRDVRACRRRT